MNKIINFIIVLNMLISKIVYLIIRKLCVKYVVVILICKNDENHIKIINVFDTFVKYAFKGQNVAFNATQQIDFGCCFYYASSS